MRHTSVAASLPIADRPASFAFYRDGLGFDPMGEPAEDGVPEPLQFVTEPGQQPWGYAGSFADPDGHIWMVRSESPAS
jgi:hypothetical protein